MTTKIDSKRAPAMDTPEEIAEMMAEAARVDALFRSGAISTLFVPAITSAKFEFTPYKEMPAAELIAAL